MFGKKPDVKGECSHHLLPTVPPPPRSVTSCVACVNRGTIRGEAISLQGVGYLLCSKRKVQKSQEKAVCSASEPLEGWVFPFDTAFY